MFPSSFLASSVATKQTKPNKINVYKVVSGTTCRHFFTSPVAAISCVWPCSPNHFLNLPTVWGLRWFNKDIYLSCFLFSSHLSSSCVSRVSFLTVNLMRPRPSRLAARQPSWSPTRGRLYGFNLAKYGEQFKVALKEFVEWLTQSQAMQRSHEHEISCQ